MSRIGTVEKTEDRGGNELDLTAGAAGADTLQSDAQFSAESSRLSSHHCVLPLFVNHICIRVIRVIRGLLRRNLGEVRMNLFLLFLAEFLESGIGMQRIPDRIYFQALHRYGTRPAQ